MDRGFHVAGVAIAIAIHVALGVGLFFADSGCMAEASSRNFDEPRYVEAALAIKGQEAEESQQPQKPRKRERAPEPDPEPDSEATERTPEPDPEPRPDKTPDSNPRPSDDLDPMEVLERNRRLAENDTVDQDGVDREEVGALAGSEWGTELDARGDPYVGELAGRVKHAWRLPSFERTEDLVTWGCVKLAADGSIVEREIAEPSGSATLDRSVSVALDRATDMEEAVPDHLRELLLEQGICFAFRP